MHSGISKSTIDFTKHFITRNRLDCTGDACWVFYPGMLFKEIRTWWPPLKNRTHPHEGIDLCFYSDDTDSISMIRPNMLVPALMDGTVVKIAPDFLGQTISIQHAVQDDEGRSLYGLYGHVVPLDTVSEGCTVTGGEPFAGVADAEQKGAPMPSHLHITIAWIDERCPPEDVSWNSVKCDSRIEMIDPLTLIDLPATLKNDNPAMM